MHGDGTARPGAMLALLVVKELKCIWRFPKIRGTFLGVPIIRAIVFWGLYWGPPLFLGNYNLSYSAYIAIIGFPERNFNRVIILWVL